ncbi:unnamed protein product [Auanema sp. JU1783]|nr:unnamed protein product [Auanema sp. JU1783]
MAFKMEPSQLRIAEKLVILNDRAAGMLTRLYNIKKGCAADSKAKPQFLLDKQMDGAIKHIIKKFPVVDTRNNMSTFSYAASIKDEIIRSLSLYYYTFADLMDLKENILQLLTAMDACQCQLDISLNYELTAGYLNLVVNMISLMILLSRIDDRKIVLGLFNAAFDLTNGQSEASFPRLGQMILDYEYPLKKLTEDLGPLNRLMHSALVSLSPVYLRRSIPADNWRTAQILSLTANPQQILFAAQTDTMACEYLSLDVMDRWIIYCGTICHSSLLNEPIIYKQWQLSLQMGICTRVFRDEVFLMHTELQHFFDSVKGLHKRSQEVKEYYSLALQHRYQLQRFLRGALRELTLLIKDQPGLLGPKILFVWMGLSFSRDEVLWLLRHLNEWPTSKKGNKGADELIDKQLPELLHYMEELRQLVIKHCGVIQRYYLKYVNSYDAILTREMLSTLSNISEEDSILLHHFSNSISNINSDTDLRALRLDWFRFQARTSMARSSFSLLDNPKTAVIMNRNVFHLKMVDLQDEMIKETSDLSIYCFYSREFERQWQASLSLPAQSRYAVVFARICSHFTSTLHDMCPEEKSHIIDRSLGTCITILDDICRTTTEVVGALCEYELRLAEQTSASQVALMIAQQLQKSKGGKTAPVPDLPLPGEESYRTDRQKLTYPDKLQTTLVELCAGLMQQRQITVSDHIFAPREYLSQHLEYKFSDMIMYMAVTDSTPRRPSELLMIVQAYMAVLQNIDTCITVDITRLFNNALLQQTQPLDSRNKETLTFIYTKWYLDVVLRRAATGNMVWSDHLQAMVSYADMNPFQPEQYTDPLELRCLAQLIGPYGVNYFSERLTWHVACQINELHKVVVAHKDQLHMARTQFDNIDKMKEVLSILCTEPKGHKSQPNSSPAECILQRTAIMGQIFMFRDALQAALQQIVEQRLPFMVASFNDLYQSLDTNGKTMVAELAAALGKKCTVDMALVNAMRAQNSHLQPDEFYLLSCLLLVAIAISLPKLAQSENSMYKPSIKGSLNNSHCIPLAITTIAGALFYLHGRQDIQHRLKEFLALASSGILRNAHENEGMEEVSKHQAALYIMLEQLVIKSEWLTMDVLEACFPYNLIRTAYQLCYDQERELYA